MTKAEILKRLEELEGFGVTTPPYEDSAAKPELAAILEKAEADYVLLQKVDDPEADVETEEAEEEKPKAKAAPKQANLVQCNAQAREAQKALRIAEAEANLEAAKATLAQLKGTKEEE